MARVSTYLNFMGTTEEAFEFYRSCFGTEYVSPFQRMGDVPGAIENGLRPDEVDKPRAGIARGPATCAFFRRRLHTRRLEARPITLIHVQGPRRP